MLRTIFALAIVLSLNLPGTAAEPAKSRMLMVTQSAGFRHQPVKRGEKELCAAEIAMTQLGQQTGLFDVDCTQDMQADFTRENLQRYDLVAFYTSGELPVADVDLAYFLDEWLPRAGHGLLGFHSATDTLKKHQPYWDMIGGSFDGHPWGAGSKVTIRVHDTTHPATQHYQYIAGRLGVVVRTGSSDGPAYVPYRFNPRGHAADKNRAGPESNKQPFLAVDLHIDELQHRIGKVLCSRDQYLSVTGSTTNAAATFTPRPSLV